jgi:hypothetical protein
MSPYVYGSESPLSERRGFDTIANDELVEIQKDFILPIAGKVMFAIEDTVEENFFTAQDFLESLKEVGADQSENGLFYQIDQWHTEKFSHLRRDLVFGLLVSGDRKFIEMYPGISKSLKRGNLFTRRGDWHWKNGPIQEVYKHGIMITIPICLGGDTYILDAFEPLYGDLRKEIEGLLKPEISGKVLGLFEQLHSMEHGDYRPTTNYYNILPQSKMDEDHYMF